MRAPRRHCACASAYGSREGGEEGREGEERGREGAGPTLAGAGEMAAAAAAAPTANGTGGSSGMEVDAAGNGPRGSGFWRLPWGRVKAVLDSREKSGGRVKSELPGLTCGRDVWPDSAVSHSRLPGGLSPPLPPPLVVPSVMASGVTGSVSVALHPLVILNISDHWIRMRSQEGRPMQGECSA